MYIKLLKKIISYSYCLFFPIFLLIYFKMPSYIFLTSFYVTLIYLFYSIFDNKKIIILTYIIFFIILLIKIIIIPLSFYKAWFEIAQNKLPNGDITNLLFILFIYFWAFLWADLSTTREISTVLLFIIMLTVVALSLVWNILAYLLLFIIFAHIINRTIKYKYFGKIPIIIFLCLFSYFLSFIVFKNSKANGSIFINSLSGNMRKFISNKIPQLDLLNSIPGLSSNFMDEKGKPPILSSNSIFLIKGYSGSRYYIRLSLDKFGKEINIKKIDNKIGYSEDFIELTVLTDFLTIMPTLNNTVKIEEYSYPNESYKILKPYIPLSTNDKIIIYRGTLPPIQEKPEFVIFNNSDNIRILALSLKGNSDLETVNNIRNYLISNYSYTLETEENKNYIEDFLFTTKKGFCIHFTRSFNLLLKLNSIPAREVSGYVVDIPYSDEDDEFTEMQEVVITGKNSHLWPEVFIDGFWITYEVTPIYISKTNNRVVNRNISKNDKLDIQNINKNYSIVTIIFILFILLLIFIFFNIRSNYIKKIIKKGEKRGISHPNLIGWVEWCSLVTDDKIFRTILLEVNYTNKVLNKSDKKYIKKIMK